GRKPSCSRVELRREMVGVYKSFEDGNVTILVCVCICGVQGVDKETGEVCGVGFLTVPRRSDDNPTIRRKTFGKLAACTRHVDYNHASSRQCRKHRGVFRRR